MNCARCGEPITCPYFFKGQVYGYSCIKKVNGGVPVKKSTVEYELVNQVQIEFFSDGQGVVFLGGKLIDRIGIDGVSCLRGALIDNQYYRRKLK